MTKIGFTGDIALSGIISSFSKARVMDQLCLRSIVGETAFVINLEAPVADTGTSPQKRRGVSLCTSGGVLTAFLEHNNIVAVTLANNHSHDYGYEGLSTTIQILDSFKIPHTGAGIKQEDLAPAVFMVNGISYALIGYVHPDTNPYCGKDLFLNVYNKEEVIAAIKQAKPLADNIILSFHWGKDYSAYPRDWQVSDAQQFINEGADIIIGHHPHVIQPFEKYKERYIFYSLGSTIFGDFYLHDRLRALPVKTKKSFIPVFSDLQSPPEFAHIKELKGNYLEGRSGNIENWSQKVMIRSRKRTRSALWRRVLDFKEVYLDRIYDIFFGYYRNPLKDIFSSYAIRNGLRIIRKKNR